MDIMTLKIYIENDELRLAYMDHIENHNKKIRESKFPDAGFDLLVPNDMEYLEDLLKIDYGIKCCGIINNRCVSYYVYPRSSISTKTNLRLANSVGIIDQGYIGTISSVFDVKKGGKIERYSKLVQICGYDLRPIIVELVKNEKELPNYNENERKYGGYGSTG